jgi:hypothetical protein
MEMIKVSKQFSADFKKVCEYHNCTPEEVKEMKVKARADFEAAEECYAMLAKEIDARAA